MLVVDDSAFARKVLREVLDAAPEVEVVGTARDGLDALTKIEQLDPDVVTLDLVMPTLDGIDTLRALAGRARPKVVVVCMAESDSEAALSALALGAVDVVHKPTALATERLYELSRELIFKVQSAAVAKSQPLHDRPLSEPPTLTREYRGHHDILLIGASTGGPQAIAKILKALPGNFPIPIAVVVHLPAGFTQSYADRMDEECALRVVEAMDGMPLLPGSVTIAHGGAHLKVARSDAGLVARVSNEPPSLHQPSVDQLFLSAVQVVGGRALAVVLTGMGDDGLAGSRVLRAAGADIFVEAEQTCVVYGMPRVIWEASLANAEYPLPEMARAILKAV